MYGLMVADDEKWIRSGIIKTINELNLNVTVTGEAEDGYAGYHFALDNPVHIVVTDIKMPCLNGLEMITRIRVKKPYVQSIIISGYASFEYAQKAIEARVNNYLLKSVKKEALRDSITAAMVELDRIFCPDGAGASHNNPVDAQGVEGDGHFALMEKVRLHVEKHYADYLSLGDICKTFYINKNTLTALCRRHWGMTFVDYLIMVRMDNAQRLLKGGHYKVRDVARLVGFSDPLYFSKVFKKTFGLTPVEALKSESLGKGQ